MVRSYDEILLLIKYVTFLAFFAFSIFRDKSSTSNMKIDTLAFLGCILAQHPPKVFHPHIHVLVPVSTCIKTSVSSVVINISLVSNVNLPGSTRYQNLMSWCSKPWDHFETFREVHGFEGSFQRVHGWKLLSKVDTGYLSWTIKLKDLVKECALTL